MTNSHPTFPTPDSLPSFPNPHRILHSTPTSRPQDTPNSPTTRRGTLSAAASASRIALALLHDPHRDSLQSRWFSAEYACHNVVDM